MKNCICYVIDDNYLFPTLVSAKQARERVATDVADVVIICITDKRDKVDLATVPAQQLGLKLIVAPQSAIDSMHPMYGRLFIDRILPPGYGRIVYLDGDTQITGSLMPLIEAEIPEGHFLAVRDPSGMFARLSNHWMGRIVGERNQAGLTGDYDAYLNTGVLVFDLEDWRRLSSETLSLIQARSESFKYGDQDPMNLAVGDRCIFISNRWNFPGFLIGSHLEATTDPVVYHFMSNPRPWTHGGLPWGVRWQAPYREMLERFPALSAIAPKASLLNRMKYHLQQTLKCLTEYRAVARVEETHPDLVI